MIDHEHVSGEGWDLYLGDCVEVMRGWATPNTGSMTWPIQIDHVITDPPYGEHVHSKPWQAKALAENGDKRTGSAHAGIDFAFLSAALRAQVSREFARLARRWVLTFCDLEGLGGWRDDLAGAGLDYVRSCIWDKVDSAPQFTGDRPANAAEAIVCAHQPGRKRWNGGGRRNVFTHAVNAQRGSKPHPTTKPDALMVELVELFTDPGDLVLDPFVGSGTTGVACLRTGRRFIGIEKDPRYFQLAVDRLRAEQSGAGTLRAYRAGQLGMFGGGK